MPSHDFILKDLRTETDDESSFLFTTVLSSGYVNAIYRNANCKIFHLCVAVSPVLVTDQITGADRDQAQCLTLFTVVSLQLHHPIRKTILLALTQENQVAMLI